MVEKFPYEDIVNMPHHVSKKHPQPTMADRVARFAPFVAITGYEKMVLEEARMTEERIDEYERLVIMTDGKKINIDDIYNIQSELFYSLGVEY